MYDYVSYPYWDYDAGLWFLACYYQGKRLPVFFDSRDAAWVWREMSASTVWESLLHDAEVEPAPEPVFNYKPDHKIVVGPDFYELLN